MHIIRNIRIIFMKKDIKYYQKKLAEKEKEINFLKLISETISDSWEIKEILNSIIKIVIEYFQSDSCFIYLVEDGEAVLQASQNPHKEKLGKIRMKIGEGITGWVAKNKETVVIGEKAYQDKRYVMFDVLPEDKFEAFLSAPIIYKKKVVGVINVQYTKKKKFNSEIVDLLETIARLVGGAMEHARLLSETDVLKEALETRKVVERAKAMITKKYKLGEEEAYNFLRKKSMDSRKSLKEIAEAVVLMEDLNIDQ